MGTKKKIFGIIPIAVILDKRLTLNDLRVYAALSSFQGKKSCCFPSLAKLAERSGVHQSHLSNNTGRLEKFGLIQKTRRGRRISNVYFVRDTQVANAAKGQAEKERSVPESETAEIADSLQGDYAGFDGSEYADPAGGDYAEAAESNIKTPLKTTPTTTPTEGEEVVFKDKYFEVSEKKVAQWRKSYPRIDKFHRELVRVSDILDEMVASGQSIKSPMAFLHTHLRKRNEELKKRASHGVMGTRTGRVENAPSKSAKVNEVVENLERDMKA